ncbi:peptidase [Mycolicibacterium sp. 018/SC-01/001]|uniref:peptidase n=1 Tax=Mycolicibacterium sp. 018/SC-01/001 TaxID=2592069 RepID=UPI00117EA8D3|nr:peptidase [Mycolicibacterium sp. 018/SC-01/001]TRW79173.1 peptidase [Mycolicibacterium sp. 018/SC-01/001]
MRRSTTSAATDRARSRRRVAALLGAEALCAALLIGGAYPAAPGPPALAATPPPSTEIAAPSPPLRTLITPDGRRVQLIDLGGGAASLLDRVAAELPSAEHTVSAFWGPAWSRDIPIVVAGSPEQFAVLAGAGPDTAATTTAERITFSPAAAAMDSNDLRIVLRHELFHFAARADTAADAPVWLTEGVADYVGRPAPAGRVEMPARLPTDAELGIPGPQRSQAYDRAWQFATFVAQSYGPQTLRRLYVAACAPGHPDPATAVRTVLGIDLPA